MVGFVIVTIEYDIHLLKGTWLNVFFFCSFYKQVVGVFYDPKR